MARVCMVVYNNYDSDGRVRREAEALIERGDSVDCICLLETPGKAASLAGVRLFSVSGGKYRGNRFLPHLISNLWFFCCAFLWVSFLHFRNRYDIVQVHTMPDFLVFTALVPKLLGAKVILDVHDLVPEVYMAKYALPYQSWFLRLLLYMERRSIAFADRAISVHRPHLDLLVAHGNPREKFCEVLNVPDHRIFVRNNVVNRSGERFRLIYHGSIARRTGMDVALRALALARKQVPGLEFQIVAAVGDIGPARTIIKELDLTDCVFFSPPVPVHELPAIILQANLGIIPYLADVFNQYVLPTKLLEYAALGIPAIVSRLRAVEAYFNDDMVAYFQPGNETELADQIVRLYRNPAIAAGIASNAARFANVYNWENQREVYYQLVDSLVPAPSFLETRRVKAEDRRSEDGVEI